MRWDMCHLYKNGVVSQGTGKGFKGRGNGSHGLSKE